MKKIEKRRLLLDLFGASPEDQVKNSNRYTTIYVQADEFQSGTSCSPYYDDPMPSISFTARLEQKDILKQQHWKGFCRRHKKPVLGLEDSVIGSSARRRSITHGNKLHSSICDVDFNHQHSRSWK